MTVGQQLQNWLIRNDMEVTHPLFVRAVDHAFENAMRDTHAPFANPCPTKRMPLRPSAESGSDAASMAT